jgi:hypothetical protein
MGQMVSGDANPGIYNGNLDLVLVPPGMDGDLTTRGSVLQSIANQVSEDLGDAVPVSQYRGKIRLQVRAELDPFRTGLGGKLLKGGLNQR